MWELQGRGSLETWCWGGLCAHPAHRDPGLWGRIVQTQLGSPAMPGVPTDRLHVYLVPCAAFLDVEPRPDASQRFNAEELDQG